MIKKTLIFMFLTNLIHCIAHAEDTRDQRENKMAENSVFWALVGANNKEIQERCASNNFYCGDNRADLGLTILGVKNSPDALSRLAELMRYRIDAGLSEDYTCYVLNKGKKISKYLMNIKPEALVAKCQQELGQAQKNNPTLFEQVESKYVCATSIEIKEELQSLIAGIRSRQHCQEGDF